jgi:hypothetical protein
MEEIENKLKYIQKRLKIPKYRGGQQTTSALLSQEPFS